MNINIGETIKKLRKDKDMTQEKFAEYLSISPQAISRWETGAAYPDITTIPVIANFFGVSADLLLGVDVYKNEEKIQSYIKEHNHWQSRGEPDKVREVLETALAEFPGDFRLLIRYAWKMKYDNNLIELCNRIIEDCKDDPIRCEAIYILSMTYGVLGDIEKAVQTANRLPGYSNTSNFMIGNLYDGNSDEHILHHQKNAEELTWHLWMEIRALHYRQKTADDKIKVLKKGIALYELMYEDGDYGFAHNNLVQINEMITACYLEKKDYDEALYHIEKCAEHCMAYDKQHGDFRHTSLMFDRIIFKNEDVFRSSSETHCKMQTDKLQDEIYNPIRDTDRFKAVIKNLSDFA